MTNGLTSPRAAERPPGPTPQAARGAPPPSDAFAGMLDAHQARTAIAEGQSSEKPAPDAAQKPACDEGPTQEPATAAADQTAGDAPAAEDAATLATTALAALVPVAAAPGQGGGGAPPPPGARPRGPRPRGRGRGAPPPPRPPRRPLRRPRRRARRRLPPCRSCCPMARRPRLLLCRSSPQPETQHRPRR